jgi:siderophore synthetase component
VADCVSDYQRANPHLAERFEVFDLFVGRFPLSCLNRLQLRDNLQMVDLEDPASALQLAGTLENPLVKLRLRGA